MLLSSLVLEFNYTVQVSSAASVVDQRLTRILNRPQFASSIPSE